MKNWKKSNVLHDTASAYFQSRKRTAQEAFSEKELDEPKRKNGRFDPGSKLERLEESLRRIFEAKEETGDVCFVVGEEQVKAHRKMIEGRSEYLDNLFDRIDPDQEKRDKVSVELIDNREEFEEILFFFYTQQIHLDGMKKAIKFLKYADALQIDELRKFCLGYIFNELHYENATALLKLAEAKKCDSARNLSSIYLFKFCVSCAR